MAGQDQTGYGIEGNPFDNRHAGDLCGDRWQGIAGGRGARQLGKKLPDPERPLIMSSGGMGALSIRAGRWKLIDGQGNCGYGEFFRKHPVPAPKPGDPPAQLYNLEEDLGERNNLYLKHPEIVYRLKVGLEKIKADENYHPTDLEQPKASLTIEQLNALFTGSKAATPAQVSAKTFQFTESRGDTTYYVDDAGDDRQPGTSPGTAWKTLTRLNAVKFDPGDRIFLKAGCHFKGPLQLRGSGAKGKPIVIDRYGRGADPVIAGKGQFGKAAFDSKD